MEEQLEHYVLIDDDGKIAALFKLDDETPDFKRQDGEWIEATFEESEKWDGFAVVTIESSFVEVFDKAQASGEILEESAVRDYKTESSSDVVSG